MMMWYCRKRRRLRRRFGVRLRDGLGLPTRPDFFEGNAPLAQEGELVPGGYPVDLGLRTANDRPRAHERAEVVQPVRADQANEDDPLRIGGWLRCTKRRPALGGDGHGGHLSPGMRAQSSGAAIPSSMHTSRSAPPIRAAPRGSAAPWCSGHAPRHERGTQLVYASSSSLYHARPVPGRFTPRNDTSSTISST